MEARLCLAQPGRSLEKAFPNSQIYADLDNMRAQEHSPKPNSNIFSPRHCLLQWTNIILLELTISGNSKEAMRQARERKQQNDLT